MIKDTNSLKKSKLIDESISTETKTLNDNINGDSSSHEDTISKSKRRRVSKSTLEVTEITRSRRRQSRQEEKEIILEKKIEEKTEEKQVIKDDSQDKEETKDTSTLSEETIERKEEETNSSEQKESDSVIIKKGEEQIEEGVPENQKNRNQDIQDDVDYDYQQRHKEALDALTHIEIEFARLRDKMYQEKMSELNEEAIMIANGTHPELVALMAEIEEKKGRRIHNAEAWRRHQHANFKQQFEGFEYQANIHFIVSVIFIRIPIFIY
ncbi:uncharacterized protein BX663DRAFT_170769 [Cokeromyces recurvatus]|uniref:uncharacterized protein n=1 Tax=Cokeromyces recurvatus TaxID=90255 RepID=UPI00221E45EB|nr:uncharacterized protein BX663DRAFT_170769 [Cokeromyces recurvatus]KAI7899956.1 hypothetical protein BX663DRAFT_170769 [Cokeromyces recurvatus]